MQVFVINIAKSEASSSSSSSTAVAAATASSQAQAKPAPPTPIPEDTSANTTSTINSTTFAITGSRSSSVSEQSKEGQLYWLISIKPISIFENLAIIYGHAQLYM